jgi:hypothetical protein
MWRFRYAALKEVLLRPQLRLCDPGRHCIARLFGKLELNRPLRLLLHNDRARSHTRTLCYIVNAKADQIATA